VLAPLIPDDSPLDKPVGWDPVVVLDPKISSKETEDFEEIVGIATLPVLVLLSAAAALDEDAKLDAAAPDPDGPCVEDD
jgi:hypothetical protein